MLLYFRRPSDNRHTMTEQRLTVRGVEMAFWDTFWDEGMGETGDTPDTGDAEAAGPPAPAVVFVHGNTGGKVWFSRVMDIPGYRTIAMDLPNFGNSGRLDVADIDVYADYLAAFLKLLGLSGSCVVGHSLGGAVAVSLAVRYPDMVQRMVLVDSPALDGLHTPEAYYPIIEGYKTDRSLLRQALQAVMPTLDDGDFLDELTTNALKMNPIAFAGNARALDRFNYEGKGMSVQIPVVVVRGERDTLITEEMARATAEAFPKSRLELLDRVGHSVMVEDPDRFIRLVSRFLTNRLR